jgi:hypothetical protein
VACELNRTKILVMFRYLDSVYGVNLSPGVANVLFEWLTRSNVDVTVPWCILGTKRLLHGCHLLCVGRLVPSLLPPRRHMQAAWCSIPLKIIWLYLYLKQCFSNFFGSRHFSRYFQDLTAHLRISHDTLVCRGTCVGHYWFRVQLRH